MKRLIMCEGPNELGIMRILLENDKLIFGEDDLIGLEPYHARQITSNGQVRTQLNMYPGSSRERDGWECLHVGNRDWLECG